MNKAAKEVQQKFVLDANVFIQSHRDHYAFDIVPGFWKSLLEQHDAGMLISIDRVKDEVLDGGRGDALEDWVKKSTPKTLWATTKDTKVAAAFGEMMNWVQVSTHYTAAAKRIFATNADGWLAAYAKVNGLILVTHEKFNADKKVEVPLPNLCEQFGVEPITTFEMLRRLKIKFN
ncbi:MAG: DUF4411 family protein [Proteobacteria bacterium]|nr:DUF4411 family protein [Pseudomonadota bacterium]MBS1936679.1 DUF4411 family protein [Bacteroidota bacterium]